MALDEWKLSSLGLIADYFSFLVFLVGQSYIWRSADIQALSTVFGSRDIDPHSDYELFSHMLQNHSNCSNCSQFVYMSV